MAPPLVEQRSADDTNNARTMRKVHLATLCILGLGVVAKMRCGNHGFFAALAKQALVAGLTTAAFIALVVGALVLTWVVSVDAFRTALSFFMMRGRWSGSVLPLLLAYGVYAGWGCRWFT